MFVFVLRMPNRSSTYLYRLPISILSTRILPHPPNLDLGVIPTVQKMRSRCSSTCTRRTVAHICRRSAAFVRMHGTTSGSPIRPIATGVAPSNAYTRALAARTAYNPQCTCAVRANRCTFARAHARSNIGMNTGRYASTSPNLGRGTLAPTLDSSSRQTRSKITIATVQPRSCRPSNEQAFCLGGLCASSVMDG